MKLSGNKIYEGKTLKRENKTFGCSSIAAVFSR